MKIAVTTSSFGKFSDTPLAILREHNLEYILNPYGRTLTAEETVSLLEGCVGVAAGTEPLTAEVLRELPELKVISRCGTGTDNVDRQYAAANDIQIYITPDAPTLAVAELVIGLAFNMFRRISVMDRHFRTGVWKKETGMLLFEKKIGVVGYGRIGKKTTELFRALGCDVACHDPYVSQTDIPQMSLDTLLAWCDCLTLHLPKPADGKPLIGSEELQKLRPGALLINTARGGLVDEQALYDALKSKHLGGAAIDVFVKEPYQGPLTDLDNIVLTPHIGSAAREARILMELETIRNLLEGLKLFDHTLW